MTFYEFKEFLGQPRVKKQLNIILNKKQIPHIGLFAASGMGKTMLATLIAKNILAKLIYFNGTAIKNSISFVQKAYEANKVKSKHHIIFIDEAHKLPKSIQENMLSILEKPAIINCLAPKSGRYLKKNALGEHIPTMVTKGQTIEVCLPDNISFILGTTHKGCLTNTILSRLEIVDFDEYPHSIVTLMLKQSNKTKPPIQQFYLEKISSISRNNRNAKRILESLESYINLTNIDPSGLTDKQFAEFCEIHKISPSDGCRSIDLIYMNTIAHYNVIGLKSLSSIIGISVEEIENTVEPWLLRRDYVKITPKGRELTPKGMKRLNIDPSQLDDTLIISDQ